MVRPPPVSVCAFAEECLCVYMVGVECVVNVKDIHAHLMVHVCITYFQMRNRAGGTCFQFPGVIAVAWLVGGVFGGGGGGVLLVRETDTGTLNRL